MRWSCPRPVLPGSPIRWAAILMLTGFALWGCSGAAGDAEWARATARTCASTLARTGFTAPYPALVAPARFLDERRRLLDERVGFNTVTPFRTVCTEIRRELEPPDPTLPAP